MLILTRKTGQSIVIGDEIEIFIAFVDGDQVKVGVTAPSDIKIFRKELLEAIQQSNREAIVSVPNVESLKKAVQFE